MFVFGGRVQHIDGDLACAHAGHRLQPPVMEESTLERAAGESPVATIENQGNLGDAGEFVCLFASDVTALIRTRWSCHNDPIE